MARSPACSSPSPARISSAASCCSLLVLCTALNAATYLWLRALGVTWLTSLVGLVLLSTSAAFAMQYRGWELDKLVEPVLFLLAALAAWYRRWPAYVLLAALAAANRETGIFAPFVALVAAEPPTNALRTLSTKASVLDRARHLRPRSGLPAPARRRRPASSPGRTPRPSRFVNVLGGLCLLPVLALALGRAAPVGLRWLLYAVTIPWVVVVLATEQVDQGLVLPRAAGGGVAAGQPAGCRSADSSDRTLS